MNVGEALAKCALCRLSPDNADRDMVHYWSPTKLAKESRHPALVSEKKLAKSLRRRQKLLEKQSRDKSKVLVSRLASSAEKRTERQIIKSTLNSGRRNKDGDHVHMGSITLDTKLQTTRENPVILLSELEKVRSDAARAGKLLGGLVIRNKHGVGCVVMREEDYARFCATYCNQTTRQDEQVGPAVSGASEASVNLVEGS